MGGKGRARPVPHFRVGPGPAGVTGAERVSEKRRTGARRPRGLPGGEGPAPPCPQPHLPGFLHSAPSAPGSGPLSSHRPGVAPIPRGSMRERGRTSCGVWGQLRGGGGGCGGIRQRAGPSRGAVTQRRCCANRRPGEARPGERRAG